MDAVAGAKRAKRLPPLQAKFNGLWVGGASVCGAVSNGRVPIRLPGGQETTVRISGDQEENELCLENPEPGFKRDADKLAGVMVEPQPKYFYKQEDAACHAHNEKHMFRFAFQEMRQQFKWLRDGDLESGKWSKVAVYRYGSMATGRDFQDYYERVPQEYRRFFEQAAEEEFVRTFLDIEYTTKERDLKVCHRILEALDVFWHKTFDKTFECTVTDSSRVKDDRGYYNSYHIIERTDSAGRWMPTAGQVPVLRQCMQAFVAQLPEELLMK